jgi:hypothetical protein
MHVRSNRPTSEQELLSRATGRLNAQALIDLIGESAPEEGVVDLHELEASFSRGAVVAEEITGEPTRRMSTAEAEAAMTAVEDVNARPTARMSAVQASELAALLAPPVVAAREHVAVISEPPVAPAPQRSRWWMLAGALAMVCAVAALFVVS